ncbi:short-chain dehydrogenase/reductase SDR [Spiroplasma clarkii]|uniref:SDR family NAD(P)-dependent oxidoreductase n=1 Tax=Spiroplasma clarkii TaxID=2139 RepID=UPI000B56ACD9|nr:SDR family NAD(P)-dependent oxidoreductase [Spiroplasma clarkii]ARU91173.1 short-chain dehydrogenase/reductase SDR [Spiroplasma clarkii]
MGFAYCEELLKQNYNIIGVARETKSLQKLQTQYPHLDIQAWDYDLSDLKNCHSLFARAIKFNVSLLINNAGYGVWGLFKDTDLEKELNMIDLNIKALHILTKLFVKHFVEKNCGRVINLASIAAFAPGPVFSTYFASKAYVLSLSTAINTELKKQKSLVRVISVCPGPIKTDFWSRSEYQNTNKKPPKIKGMTPEKFCHQSLKRH